MNTAVKPVVLVKDLGLVDYKQTWEYQQQLMDECIARKLANRGAVHPEIQQHYLLFCEHPAVFTLGKSGSMANLLVDEAGQVFFIDCPTGAFWWGPFLRYRIVKDLACLDKVACKVLSRTQRLRFYLQYRGRARLNAADKKRIRRIIGFFEGRE